MEEQQRLERKQVYKNVRKQWFDWVRDPRCRVVSFMDDKISWYFPAMLFTFPAHVVSLNKTIMAPEASYFDIYKNRAFLTRGLTVFAASHVFMKLAIPLTEDEKADNPDL